jgi:hypothetical protein
MITTLATVSAVLLAAAAWRDRNPLSALSCLLMLATAAVALWG